ncbi:MAG: NlpC/P60 family protein [Spirochaetota bacterium]|nr:NlpC/P60 family protein [Spirochaetota bacterium]
MLIKKYTLPTVLILLFVVDLYADTLDSTLKQDFTAQQTIKIRFEVNKRLYSFKAGRFRLEKIKKNRDKINRITQRIIPWAIMEHLEPAEVARIIVYMYHADEAGASFQDAEDLIPLIAQRDIPLKDFILMVQYNRETKKAQIPEEIRQSFLGKTVLLKWDGVSTLTGGRGLVLARNSKLNINKTASLLLKRLPPNGAKISSENLVSIIEDIIGQSVKEKKSQEIMHNLSKAHNVVNSQVSSPKMLKDIIDHTYHAEHNIQHISNISIPNDPKVNKKIDREKGIIPELEDKYSKPSYKNWKILNRKKLYQTIKPWIGTPYKFGEKKGRGGIDCSGFTRIILIDKKIGVPSDKIPHGTAKQSRSGVLVKRKSLREGDLVFFSASPNRSKITHVGLVTSAKTFSHASSSRGVINDNLSAKWWRKRFVKGRRLFIEVAD